MFVLVVKVGGASGRAGVSSALTRLLNKPVKRNIHQYLEFTSSQMTALMFYLFALIFYLFALIFGDSTTIEVISCEINR